MSGPKLLWLQHHEPQTMGRARRVLLIPDYLIFRLTGHALTDRVTAWTSGLYDQHNGRWVAELLDACGVSDAMMPRALLSGESAGRLTPEAAAELGLPESVLVAAGSNDQNVGAVGAGNVEPGCASIAFGTALAIVCTTGQVSHVPDGILPMLHPVHGIYALLAYAKTSGIVVRWFRDHFAPSLSYDELFAEIASAPIGADGLSCLPHFSGAGSPTYNAAARGAFAGLTLSHTRAHLARAVVESLTFSVRENLELLGPAAGGLTELRAIGGGSQSDIWMQMVADSTGIAVERPATSEAACLGAAELGMVAAGRFESVETASLELYRSERRFEPNPAMLPAYDEAFERYQQLYQSLYGDRKD